MTQASARTRARPAPTPTRHPSRWMFSLKNERMDTSPLFDQVEIPPIASTISGYSTSTFIFESKTGQFPACRLPCGYLESSRPPRSARREIEGRGWFDRKIRLVRCGAGRVDFTGFLNNDGKFRRTTTQHGAPRHGVCRRRLPTAFADGVCRRRLPTAVADGVCRRRWPTAFADGVCFQSKIFGPTMPRCLDTCLLYTSRCGIRDRANAVGKRRRPTPSANAVGNRRRQTPSANAVGQRRRQTPSATAVGKRRRQTPSANAVGKRRRQPPSANAVGKRRRPTPSANAVGNRRRQTPSANAVGQRRRQTPSATAVGKRRRQTPSANAVGKRRRQPPSANAVGKRRRPTPSANAVGNRRRQTPSANAVGQRRRQTPSATAVGKRRRQTPVSYTHLDVYKRQAFADGVCRRRLPTAFADGVCFQSKIFGPTMPRCLDTAHRYDNRPMRHRDPRCPQPVRRPSPAGMRRRTRWPRLHARPLV